MGSSPSGRVIAEMMRNGDLDRHITNLRRTYLKKLERVEDALEDKHRRLRDLYAAARRVLPLVATAPDLNSRDVQMAANERGVVVGQAAVLRGWKGYEPHPPRFQLCRDGRD